MTTRSDQLKLRIEQETSIYQYSVCDGTQQRRSSDQYCSAKLASALKLRTRIFYWINVQGASEDVLMPGLCVHINRLDRTLATAF